MIFYIADTHFGHENVTENAVRRLRNPHKYTKKSASKKLTDFIFIPM